MMTYDAVALWEEPLPERVARATDRISSTPTIASLAARCLFDAQVCHLRILQYDDEKIIPSRNDENTEADLALKRMRISKSTSSRPSTSSSRNARMIGTSSSEGGVSRPVTASTDQRPGTAHSQRPGINFQRRYYLLHLGYRSADGAPEIEEITKRVMRPTSSSIGAKDLDGKCFNYYNPKPTKTYPLLPQIETRFSGNRQVTEDEYDSMLKRLTRPTKSSHYKLKSEPDPNEHPKKRCYSAKPI